MPVVLRQVLIGLGVVALQWLVFGRLKLWGAYPDVVLLYVAYIALRFGRVPGTASGFAAGLLMDMLHGTWGIHMFVKTLLGFIVGLFESESTEGPRLGPVQTAIGTLGLALIHNGLFVVFLALAHSTRTPTLVWALWLGAALYTTVVAVVWSLVQAR
ncbi:MAG: rod shape-determining protein MreD [Bacteroidota bacterium]